MAAASRSELTTIARTANPKPQITSATTPGRCIPVARGASSSVHREDLNEEQRGRSLQSRGEKTSEARLKAKKWKRRVKNRRVSSSAEICQDLLPDPQFS